MTPVFADSSALVKLYADEPDAELVRAVPLLVVSQLVRVEVPAALWRKHRAGELRPRTPGCWWRHSAAEVFPDEPVPERSVLLLDELFGTAAGQPGSHLPDRRAARRRVARPGIVSDVTTQNRCHKWWRDTKTG